MTVSFLVIISTSFTILFCLCSYIYEAGNAVLSLSIQ